MTKPRTHRSGLGAQRQREIVCGLFCCIVRQRAPDAVFEVQVYEDHLPDAFAAMLDMSQRVAGPMVYFYCLSNPKAAPNDIGYNAFAAAHHVVLDTSVPFQVVEVSLSGSPPPDTQRGLSGKAPESWATKETGASNGTASTRMHMRPCGSMHALPEDDSMCLSQG
jgi:hypothetical protein